MRKGLGRFSSSFISYRGVGGGAVDARDITGGAFAFLAAEAVVAVARSPEAERATGSETDGASVSVFSLRPGIVGRRELPRIDGRRRRVGGAEATPLDR